MAAYSAERRANIGAGRRRGAALREPQRIAAFWQLVERGASSDCWLWRGLEHSSGYGQFFFRGRVENAHRVAYMLERGPIAPGMCLDHVVCSTRLCVNPWHVEQATQRENILRGAGLAAQNARKTQCKYGHPYTAENTRINREGYRCCRACERERSAWRRQHDPNYLPWLQRRKTAGRARGAGAWATEPEQAEQTTA